MAKSNFIRLFPLDRVLFPYMIMPIHIYEERYKEMFRLCQEEKSNFGIIHIDSMELGGVGTEAKIIHVTKEYEDGRIDIIVKGESQFKLLDIDEELSFLRAETEILYDDKSNFSHENLDTMIELYYKFLESMNLDGDQRNILDNLAKNSDRAAEISYLIAQTIGLDTKSQIDLLRFTTSDERVDFLIKKLWKHHSVNEIAETLFVKKGFDPIMN